jgi:predicted dehydrogenase
MIRIAVVGAGAWGPNLIRNFHNWTVSEVLWVVDQEPRRLEQVRMRFPGIQVGTDVGAVFRDPRVDAVVIATPTTTHYPLVSAALGHGKHVLVEKPIASRLSEAEALLALAEKQQRLLMVGHVFVYNAGIQKVAEYLQAGLLGNLYYISMIRTNLGPIRMDVNAAWDLASHDLSIVNYWLGAEPLSVSALGGTWINPGIADAVFATLRYPDGVMVHLHASWLNPRKTRDITLVGERRMLTFDDMNLNEPVRIYDKQVTDERTSPSFVDSFASFRASVREGDITIPKVSLGEPLKVECEHFLDCIATGKQPLTGAKEGVAVVRALEALRRSMEEGGLEQKVTP